MSTGTSTSSRHSPAGPRRRIAQASVLTKMKKPSAAIRDVNAAIQALRRPMDAVAFSPSVVVLPDRAAREGGMDSSRPRQREAPGSALARPTAAGTQVLGVAAQDSAFFTLARRERTRGLPLASSTERGGGRSFLRRLPPREEEGAAHAAVRSTTMTRPCGCCSPTPLFRARTEQLCSRRRHHGALQDFGLLVIRHVRE